MQTSLFTVTSCVTNLWASFSNSKPVTVHRNLLFLSETLQSKMYTQQKISLEAEWPSFK